jgi:hypothetical protein
LPSTCGVGLGYVSNRDSFYFSTSEPSDAGHTDGLNLCYTLADGGNAGSPIDRTGPAYRMGVTNVSASLFCFSHLFFVSSLSSLGKLFTATPCSSQNFRHKRKRGSNCPVSSDTSFEGVCWCSIGSSTALLVVLGDPLT